MLTVGYLATAGIAAPIPLTLDANDFNDLGVTGAATVLKAEAFVKGDWSGTVYSQAFNLDTGDYLYLYQVDNDGPDIIEVVVVNPLTGLDTNRCGYLDGNEPSGFLADGNVPAGGTYDPGVVNLSWQWPSYQGQQVDPNEHTVALYIVSPYGPREGMSYVIDSGNPAAPVWVDVPEPMSAALLVVGSTVLLIRRRRRQRT